MKRGISLVEVLFSIFVIAIGLMGLAALLPVGQSYLSRAAIEDNKAALGQAALREVKIRGMLRPSMWKFADGSDLNAAKFNGMSSVVIDPLMISRAQSSATFFPRNQSSGLPRVTLNGMLPYAIAERVFLGKDDLFLEKWKDPRGQIEVPYQEGRHPGTSGSPNPNRYRSRPFQGNYSWMVTIAREPVDNQWTQYGGDYERPVTVSAVISYKRVLDVNTEWVLNGTMGTGGFAGGDVELRWQPGQMPTDAIDRRRAIRPGKWIMLMSTNPQGYHRWYRIARVDDGSNDPIRRVTLHGPDWPIAVAGTNVQAVVIESVVGVYEERMQFEQASEWMSELDRLLKKH